MSVKPVYVVCVFNVYADESDIPGETEKQRAERQQTYHFAGFTAKEADEAAERSFHNSCSHNWWPPVLLGEFPIGLDESGREFIDADLICPRCGKPY